MATNSPSIPCRHSSQIQSIPYIMKKWGFGEWELKCRAIRGIMGQKEVVIPKRFCVTGTCISEKNYMIDIGDRIEQIIERYIEHGQYFTMNRARQYGKTTTLFLLERALWGNSITLRLSCEATDEGR